MQLPLDYMLKMGLFLAATGMFYFLLLRRLTQYNWNRWFLLVSTILSFVIPLININSLAKPEKFSRVFFVNKIPVVENFVPAASQQDNSFNRNIQLLLFLLFALTAMVLLARLAVQLFSLKKITSKAELVSKGDILLYNVEDDIAPFSFNRSIYINKSMYSLAELEEVIRHEMVHVKQKHTYDVMVAEILCILNWYNPFAWLLKTAIKQNLEFIADDVVLKSNISKKDYQYLLLRFSGNIPIAITNNLNFSALKNRIAMMNKAKTSRLHLLKLMFIIPVACVLLVAFRQTHNSKEPENTKAATRAGYGETFTLGTLTYAINDASAEMLIKKEQSNSFLKPGSVLSLSSIKDEKFRLSNLLKQNGFDTSGGHAVYFMVDTFSTNKSFSIQVTVNVPPRGSVLRPKNKTSAFTESKFRKTSAAIGGKIVATLSAHANTVFLPLHNVKSSA